MSDYIVISNRIVEKEISGSYRTSHLDYLTQLKKTGKLKMAGKFHDGSGGLYILVANSLKEALEMADADPYHFNMFRNYTLKKWERKL